MIENQNSYPMNLLVTLDRNYVPQLNVMLFSALQSDPAAFFDVYILHDEGLSASDLTATRAPTGSMPSTLKKANSLPSACAFRASAAVRTSASQGHSASSSRAQAIISSVRRQPSQSG